MIDFFADSIEGFRHLVTTQNTRAVVPRDELRQLLGSTPHADGVIEKLVSARLLVASENEAGKETIEIIHEALLVAWPRLVDWRREDVEGARFREQFAGVVESEWIQFNAERNRGTAMLPMTEARSSRWGLGRIPIEAEVPSDIDSPEAAVAIK